MEHHLISEKEKEGIALPNLTHHQDGSPARKPASGRTSPKRAYHHTSWSAPDAPLLPNSSQPFLHLEQESQSPFCLQRLKIPRLHSVRFPSITFIADSRPFWLTLYFIFNLGLTLYNKLVLVSYPWPYSLTAVHAFSGTIGASLMLASGAFVPARLSNKEWMSVAAFSVLYTVNIAVSNISLQLVTVPFHQVVRAATPVFTVALSALLLSQYCSKTKLIALIPVMTGVGFATYGDYYFTYSGFLLTILGTFLAALKTILTNVFQTPSPAATTLVPTTGAASASSALKKFRLTVPVLHPLDLLLRMSPLAFAQCVLFALLSGELTQVCQYARTNLTPSEIFAIACNGALAFGLNVVSFTANKKVGALSMTVAANVKQALTILCAVTLFNLTITSTNALGILLTLAGGAWYAVVEYREKQSARKRSNINIL